MNDQCDKLMEIYRELYSLYGPQGWWPLTTYEGVNPTKMGSLRGYHPLNYDLPETRDQVFEVMIGAILTQNTAWTMAEKAVLNLKNLEAINPVKLLQLPNDVLKEAIRCAGFMNQKSIYLIEISKFYNSLKNRIPARGELLQVKGVGNETADSILLYAFKQPEFVIDTYTKRILSHYNIVDDSIRYMDLKKLFESNIPRNITIYQEYHALIVEHAKNYYNKKPYGVDDPLKN